MIQDESAETFTDMMRGIQIGNSDNKLTQQGHLQRYLRLVDELSAQLQPEDGPPGGPGVIDMYPG